jgi:hypothetical protein
MTGYHFRAALGMEGYIIERRAPFARGIIGTAIAMLQKAAEEVSGFVPVRSGAGRSANAGAGCSALYGIGSIIV